MLHDAISTLIGQIYDSAHNAAAWRAMLADLCEHTNSHFMLSSAIDARTLHFASQEWHGPQDGRFWDGIGDYHAGFHLNDPTKQFGARYPNAGSVSLRQALREFGRDPDDDPYVHWLRDHLAGGDCVVRYSPASDGLLFGISVHPTADRKVHSREDLALFELLFGHMNRAMRLAIRPPQFEGDEPTLLIDGFGNIVRISPGAERLIAQRDGIDVDRGRLVAVSRTATAGLDRAINAALGAGTTGSIGGAVHLPRTSGQPDLIARVSPLSRPEGPFAALAPAALIRILDPERDASRDSAALWAQLYRLTPAEVRLVTEFMADDSNLRTIAERLGIAYETARVHLASVFEKVGVRSQAQLARHLTRVTG